MMHIDVEDYVDDYIVKYITREEHIAVLRKVFQRCRKYSLKMNP